MFRSVLAASYLGRKGLDPDPSRPSLPRPWTVLAFAAFLSATGIAGLYLHHSSARTMI